MSDDNKVVYDAEYNIKTPKIPYKSMTYPVDRWGRLGGLFSLVDVPVEKYVKYQELSKEDKKRIDRHHA